jgi:hypothetical protein
MDSGARSAAWMRLDVLRRRGARGTRPASQFADPESAVRRLPCEDRADADERQRQRVTPMQTASATRSSLASTSGLPSPQKTLAQATTATAWLDGLTGTVVEVGVGVPERWLCPEVPLEPRAAEWRRCLRSAASSVNGSISCSCNASSESAAAAYLWSGCSGFTARSAVLHEGVRVRFGFADAGR